MSACDAADAMARGVRAAGFDDVRVLPLADGGEGTLDALLAAVGGSRRTARVTGPLGERVDAEWASPVRRHRGRRGRAGERARARQRPQRPVARDDPRHR